MPRVSKGRLVQMLVLELAGAAQPSPFVQALCVRRVVQVHLVCELV